MRLRSVALTLILTINLFAGCNEKEPAADQEYYLFIGTYTRESSEGIYLYKFDASDGTLDSLGASTGVENPSYLTVSPDQNYVYAVNEMADSAEATVSAFEFDRDHETLTFLNKQSSGGGAPCYIALDQTGQYAFVANYLGGSFSMLPINEDGTLKQAKQVIQHNGSSVNTERQESPHVHCSYPTPDNNALMVNDLGTDYVKQYAFDAEEGQLSESPSYEYKAEPGSGPRHITFSPDGSHAYLIEELSGSVIAFKNHKDSLEAVQSISALPENYGGAISGADIHVSPDGKFLYASLREDLNQIVIYNIDQESGRLSFVGRQSTEGQHPRNFMIDPTGQYLLAANMNSDNIVVFRRDKSSGKLELTGTELKLSMPVCLKMIPVQ